MLLTEKLKEYRIVVENIKTDPSEQPTIMASVLCKDGGYVGRVEDFLKLLDMGILPESSKHNFNDAANCGHGSTANIGKSFKDGKWYGWSHRAMFGFQIGDVVKEGDCTNISGWTDEHLAQHPEADISLPVGFIAKSEEDAKRMAMAFAESVS